jgi:hypothetical protein
VLVEMTPLLTETFKIVDLFLIHFVAVNLCCTITINVSVGPMLADYE